MNEMHALPPLETCMVSSDEGFRLLSPFPNLKEFMGSRTCGYLRACRSTALVLPGVAWAAYERIARPEWMSAYITGLYVAESMRGRGIGSFMVRLAEAAAAADFDPFMFELHSSISLAPMYARLGYSASERPAQRGFMWMEKRRNPAAPERKGTLSTTHAASRGVWENRPG